MIFIGFGALSALKTRQNYQFFIDLAHYGLSEELTGDSLFERKIAIFAETGRGFRRKRAGLRFNVMAPKGRAEGNGRSLLRNLFAYK